MCCTIKTVKIRQYTIITKRKQYNISSQLSKRYGFNMDFKTDIEEADLIERGRAFHSLGAETEKALSPLYFNFNLGMHNNLWLDD